MVDKVSDTEEIVVKPLSNNLKGISTYSGATVMGDGRIALILDVIGLAKIINVASKSGSRHLQRNKNSGLGYETKSIEEEKQQVLLVRSPGDGRLGIPLAEISRLEKFRISSIEQAGDVEVIQYRNGIMPLARIEEILPERRKNVIPISEKDPSKSPDISEEDEDDDSDDEGDIVQVVVINRDDQSVGVIVDRILDVVEEDIGKLSNATRTGVLGSLVINGRVTEILNVEEAVLKKFSFGRDQVA